MKHFREIVEKHFKLDIGRRTRNHDYVFARACYFKLCREIGGYGYARIGRTLSINHATVMHGLKKALPAILMHDNFKKREHDRLLNKFEHYNKIKHKKFELDELVIEYNKILLENTAIENINKELRAENEELRELIYKLADTD